MSGTLAQALQHGLSLGLPRLEVQMLLLLAVQQDPGNRAWLLAHDQDPLSADSAASISGAAAQYSPMIHSAHVATRLLRIW